jgi:ABC-2 type transport system permease protein
MGADQVTHDPLLVLLFFVAVLLAWLINFACMAIMGVAGFYVESSLSLWQLFFGFFYLLSGYLVPVSLLPGWLRTLAQVLPFRYMLSLPIEVLLGNFDRAAALWQVGVQLSWTAALLAVLALAWRAGVRHFNAYGG